MNKASLTHIEQLVMTVIFALAAALCLGLFVKAQNITEATEQKQRAVFIAQNTAEMLKNRGTAATPDIPEGYEVELTPLNSGIDGMGKGEISVIYKDKIIFSMVTGWQEETDE